jgi:hypothetical protein
MTVGAFGCGGVTDIEPGDGLVDAGVASTMSAMHSPPTTSAYAPKVAQDLRSQRDRRPPFGRTKDR